MSANRHKSLVWVGSTVIFVCAVIGCAQKGADTTVTALERTVQSKESEINRLETSVSELERDLAAKEREAEAAAQAKAEARAREAASTASSGSGTGSDLYPPNARPGECYARVFVPPTYNTVTEQVLQREASDRIEIIPAKYATRTEKVLVKEAGNRLVVVPAEYKWEEKKVLVKEAHTTWKKGRGPVEKVDNATGEIMCLVETPAQYKTVRAKVVAKPATTRTVEIPAEYKTVTVKRMVTPPQERRIQIPAQYDTVTTTKRASDEKLEWQEVLCETNMAGSTIRRVQSALREAGYDPGPIDGIYGAQTQSAVRSYQQSQGLPTGGLTMAALNQLVMKPVSAGPPPPMFPCDPPRPSARAALNRDWLVSEGEKGSLGDVNRILKEALDATGYVERSYRYLDCDPDGFVLVTRMERMYSDGRLMEVPARWDLKGGEVRKPGILSWVKALFKADSGHYRVIIFVVSSNQVIPTTRKPVEKEMLDLLTTGLSRLPDELVPRDFGPSHGCEVLIYEFEKDQGRDAELVKSPIPAMTHLERNGIARKIRGR